MNTGFKILFAVSALIFVINTPLAHADDDVQETVAIAKQFAFITMEQAQAKALVVKPGVVKEAEVDKHGFGKGWITRSKLWMLMVASGKSILMRKPVWWVKSGVTGFNFYV